MPPLCWRVVCGGPAFVALTFSAYAQNRRSEAQLDLCEIIVTGTRIRRVEGQAATLSITTYRAEELIDQGDISLGDALNDLPALRATWSQANSSRFIGTAGMNWLDLRGLGPERTLVLVNNRRHVTSSPGDNFVDVNSIPSGLDRARGSRHRRQFGRVRLGSGSGRRQLHNPAATSRA